MSFVPDSSHMYVLASIRCLLSYALDARSTLGQLQRMSKRRVGKETDGISGVCRLVLVFRVVFVSACVVFGVFVLVRPRVQMHSRIRCVVVVMFLFVPVSVVECVV